jgi:hypothetical protein
LVALFVSTGACAGELLGLRQQTSTPASQLISVIRKGSRVVQQLPASTDAFVWLRIYRQEYGQHIPVGPQQPVWWARRQPARPLTYHAARAA